MACASWVKKTMSGKGVIYWLEGTNVKSGRLLAWEWLPCDVAAACVQISDGSIKKIYAEDVFMSRGEAMKALSDLAGV